MACKGGYTFKNFEGSAQPVVYEFPIPKTVSFTLKKNALPQWKPIVKEGDVIRTGEKILVSYHEPPFCIVSPVNGTIKHLTVDSISLASDGSSSFLPVPEHLRAPWHLDREKVFDTLSSTGCGILLPEYTSPVVCDSVQHIIINAVHNRPLDQKWIPEFGGNSELFSHGLRTLNILFPHAAISIAANKRNREYFSAPGISDKSSIIIVSNRYPQEHPELLSSDVINKRLTSPAGVRDNSILVIPFMDVMTISEVMTTGRPFIDRLIMVAGPGVSQPGWYRIRIGTTFAEIKQHLMKSDEYGPWRFIRGDLFNGETILSPDSCALLPTDSEITIIREHTARELFRFMNPGFTYDSYSKTTAAEFIPLLPKQVDSNVHGGVRPCIQCNYCDEVCPVDIYPFMIWKHVTAKTVEQSFRFKPFDCISCRLCDYVCPSKIDLSRAIESATDEYRRMRKTDEKPRE
jgi:Na(+)-translocating NADH:ubiquinone oxidoreductase A subunit